MLKFLSDFSDDGVKGDVHKIINEDRRWGDNFKQLLKKNQLIFVNGSMVKNEELNQFEVIAHEIYPFTQMHKLNRQHAQKFVDKFYSNKRYYKQKM